MFLAVPLRRWINDRLGNFGLGSTLWTGPRYADGPASFLDLPSCWSWAQFDAQAALYRAARTSFKACLRKFAITSAHRRDLASLKYALLGSRCWADGIPPEDVRPSRDGCRACAAEAATVIMMPTTSLARPSATRGHHAMRELVYSQQYQPCRQASSPYLFSVPLTFILCAGLFKRLTPWLTGVRKSLIRRTAWNEHPVPLEHLGWCRSAPAGRSAVFTQLAGSSPVADEAARHRSQNKQRSARYGA